MNTISFIDNQMDFETEGVKVFPRFIKIGEKYSISKRMKGVHKKSTCLNEIGHRKQKMICDYLLNKGFKYKTSSMISNSEYYIYNEVEYRISDHTNTFHKGIIILVKWNTDMTKVLEYFNSLPKTGE